MNKSQRFSGEVVLVSDETQMGNLRFKSIVLKEKLAKGDNFAEFTATNTNMQQLDGVKERDFVEIDYNLNGKYKGGRYWNNLLLTSLKVVKPFKSNLFNSGDCPIVIDDFPTE